MTRMTTSTEPDWLVIEEAADLMRLPVNTLYNLNAQGDAPPRYRVGRRVLYKRSEVNSWIENRRVESGPQLPVLMGPEHPQPRGRGHPIRPPGQREHLAKQELDRSQPTVT